MSKAFEAHRASQEKNTQSLASKIRLSGRVVADHVDVRKMSTGSQIPVARRRTIDVAS